MKFPRNEDGTINFNAFVKLSRENKVLAVQDLKANGTREEKILFNELNKKMMEASTKLREMQEKMQKLDLEAAQLREESKQEILGVTSQLRGPDGQYIPAAAQAAIVDRFQAESEIAYREARNEASKSNSSKIPSASPAVPKITKK
jgi:hypothetical protein